MNSHRLYALLSPFFRRPRMRRFISIMKPVPNGRILDVGGTLDFWSDYECPGEISLLNPNLPPASFIAAAGSRRCLVVGDGCSLSFADRSFDIVFSNSAIEHVGTWDRQQSFAREARRVGRKLWIQTPAREFFFEPHFLTPLIHWLPCSWQRRLVRNFTLRGWIDRPTLTEVESFLVELRLLTKGEMRVLFPDCTILHERFLGLTKSYIALRNSP